MFSYPSCNSVILFSSYGGPGFFSEALVICSDQVQVILFQLLKVKLRVVGSFYRTDQLGQFDLDRLGITVLSVLDQEHHQEGDDGDAGIDR